eukprot:1152007-Pelagomonas_calceolata.AAC.1
MAQGYQRRGKEGVGLGGGGGGGASLRCWLQSRISGGMRRLAARRAGDMQLLCWWERRTLGTV